MLGAMLPHGTKALDARPLESAGWSRCFYSGNYQTFLAVHLSFKGIKLTLPLCAVTGALHNFIKLFILETELIFCKGVLCGSLITFTGEHVYRGAGEPITVSRKATFKRRLPLLLSPPSEGPWVL